jgi:hypothetical protein
MSEVAQTESRDQSGRERSTGGGSGLFGRGWWDMMAKVFSIQHSAVSIQQEDTGGPRLTADG